MALYTYGMAKEVIHVSKAEAASNFATLLERVSEGAEVIIESEARPVAVMRAPTARGTGPGRLLSESIAILEARGSTVTLDADFGRDLEEIINSHDEPLAPPTWD